MRSGDIASPHAFLTYAVDGSELSVLRLSRFTPGRKSAIPIGEKSGTETAFVTRWVSQANFRGYASRAYILFIMKLVNRVLTVFQCSVYFPPSVLRNRHWVYFQCLSPEIKFCLS